MKPLGMFDGGCQCRYCVGRKSPSNSWKRAKRRLKKKGRRNANETLQKDLASMVDDH